jgi:hypothetical protein
LLNSLPEIIRSTVPRIQSSPVEVEVPGGKEQDSQVASDEGSKDAQIPPPVLELVTKRLVELVANLVCAILAHIGRIVEKVARCTTAKEIGHVLSAILSLGSAELIEFARVANDGQVVKFGDYHAADKAREGVELVEPYAPEFRDQRLRNSDTAEQSEDDDDLN